MTEQQPLHIAHIVDLRVVGGIERILVEFIKATAHIQHTLVLFDQRIHPSLQASLNALSQIKAIHSAKHWHSLPLPKSMRIANRRRILHASQADVLLNWSQVLDMRDLRLPIVFYEHGSAWESYRPEQLNQCYASVHHAIAVSHAAMRMLQLHHHFQPPIDTIANTVFEKPAVQAQPKTYSPNKSFVLGAAGRLVQRKNFAVLLHAMHILVEQGHDVRLKIAGTGPDAARLSELVSRLSLTKYVELLGYQQDMSAFFQQLDVFVCSSIYESYGLVAIEAFAAGVPVVGVATDGMPEVVSHGINGLCLAPQLTAEQYEQLMGEPAQFAHLWSYQPQTDALQAQQSMCPSDLARSIIELIERPETHALMSQAALEAANHVKPFTQLAQEIEASVRKALYD